MQSIVRAIFAYSQAKPAAVRTLPPNPSDINLPRHFDCGDIRPVIRDGQFCAIAEKEDVAGAHANKDGVHNAFFLASADGFHSSHSRTNPMQTIYCSAFDTTAFTASLMRLASSVMVWPFCVAPTQTG
jgi:hypothetical protein